MLSLANVNVKGDFMFSYDNKNEYFEPEPSLQVADSSLPVASLPVASLPVASLIPSIK
jgi:hypothetical protein